MYKARITIIAVLALVLGLSVIPCFATDPTSSDSNNHNMTGGAPSYQPPSAIVKTNTQEITRTTTNTTGVQYTDSGMRQDYTKQTVTTTTRNEDGTKTVAWKTTATYNNADGSVTKSVWNKQYTYDADGKVVKATSGSTTTTTSADGKIVSKQTNTDTYTIKDGKATLSQTSVSKVTTNATTGTTTTDSRVIVYTYNDKGERTGATGTRAISTKYANGHYSLQQGTDTYTVLDGHLKFQSEKLTGTSYDEKGQKIATTSTSKNWSYTQINGKWQLSGSTRTDNRTNVDGSKQSITSNYGYQRNADGVATGMSLSKTGTKMTVNANGGKQNFVMANYAATISYSPTLGAKLQSETYNWNSVN